MIPKIIHQTAPEDKNAWHPCWEICQKSIRKQFSLEEFEYILWNDEQMDKFIEKNYGNYWEDYNSIQEHIIKIDLFRYFVLHFYGGIYIDMDIFCHKNFYGELKSNICIIESGHGLEVLQNSLMASVPKDDFWIFCVEECLKRYKSLKPEEFLNFPQYVHIVSGPKLLESIYFLYKDSNNIKKLNCINYCMSSCFYHKNQFTVHMATGQWGEKLHYVDMNEVKTKFNSIQELKKNNYIEKRLNGNANILKFYEEIVKDI